MKRKPSADAPGAPSSSSQRTSSPSRSGRYPSYEMSDRGRSPGPSGLSSHPGSRQGSQSPRPPPGSRSPSEAPAGQPGWAPPMGRDPAKPLETERKFNRVELPADAYSLDRPDLFAARPKAPTVGQPARLEVNQYKVQSYNFDVKVHQYDVALSPNPSKPVPVLKKIWKHPKFVAAFPPGVHEHFIFDGRKLAWSTTLIPREELRVAVDLDEGKSQPRKGGESQFYIILRKTTEINPKVLDAYLSHQCSLNNAVIETMTFLDHLLRAWPSQRLLSIKRNFYNTSRPGRPLMDGSVVEVSKGLYWSARISASQGSIGLAIAADVANTAFFVGNQDYVQLAINFLATQDQKLRGLNPLRLQEELKPVFHRGIYVPSEAFKQLRKLSKMKITVKHANRPAHLTSPIGVDSFSFDARNGVEGTHAQNTFFEHDGKKTSVADYFQQKYKVTLRYPRLPLIKTGKGAFIPMEIAYLEKFQRYPFKLNPSQTQSMIKIAVTRPNQRRADIQSNVADLQIQNDPFLRHYGIRIDPHFTKTDGRVLPPPLIHFQNGAIDPKTSGRWIVQGKRLWRQNTAPLDSWGFLVLQNCVDKPTLENFSKVFTSVFREHGGKCTRDPMLLHPPGNVQHNAAEAIMWAHQQLTSRSGYPQMLFVIVRQKGDPSYERIKKSADCRFGIGSQVLASQGVQAAQKQYASNIALKINAKLGGTTARTDPPWGPSKAKTYFPPDRPTMIVGCDISHAAPGAPNGSVAAMTMSVDPDANRYAAAVQTNGRRTEMLTPDNCQSLFGQLAEYWKEGHPNKFPKHVIYLRDGVSEGEFAKVLDLEVAQFKAYFSRKAPNMPMPRFTVICATKRHHIRFFPERGDRNGNPLPGTIVDRDVTHPRLWDFFLCSHVAIQGTSRPCHYHVLLDEMKAPPADLQAMLYGQCYSYARSTTPVSQHPAIYYAHLAGNRARAHENLATSEGPVSGGKGHQAAQINLAKGASTTSQSGEVLQLLPLGGRPQGEPAPGEIRQRNFWRSTAWFM